MKPTLADALESFAGALEGLSKDLNNFVMPKGGNFMIDNRKELPEDAIYSLFVKPTASTVAEILSYGYSKEQVWAEIQTAFEMGVRRFEQEKEKADAGH